MKEVKPTSGCHVRPDHTKNTTKQAM